MPRVGIWGDPQNIERLKAYWSDPDLRTADLAQQLGITRGAVIGKANRLGLGPKAIPHHWQPRSDADGRSTRPSRAQPAEPLRDEIKRTTPKNATHPWHGSTRKPPTSPRAFDAPAAPTPLLMRDFKGIVGAPGCECRWPLPGQADREGWMEETLFCGAPVAEIPSRKGAPPHFASYCAQHLERAVNRTATKLARSKEATAPDRLKSQRRYGPVFSRAASGEWR